MPTTGRSRSVPSLAAGVLDDFRRALVPLLAFEVLFKCVVALFSLGAGAIVLAILVRTTGSSAVTNDDLVRFGLSPQGVLVGAILLVSTLLVLVVEHLGVMAIVARSRRGQGLRVRDVAEALAGIVIRSWRLKGMGLAFLALTAAPIALLAGLTYAALLSRHDINYYLHDRPPSFFAAVGIGGILGAVFLGIVAFAYVRTVFLFPIMLYEDREPRSAVRESLARTRGVVGSLGAILLGWQGIGLVLSAAVVRGFGLIAAMLLHAVASHLWTLVPAVALLMAVQGVLLAVLSFFLVTTHCLIIVSLYRRRNEELGVGGPIPPSPLSEQDARGLRSFLRYWRLGLAVSLGSFLLLCYSVLHSLTAPERVIVTAHKGFSAIAPENTLSSFRKAIEVGADYAELDVQATSDGAIVVNHDRDLMRVGNDPRRIRDMTLAEVKAVDVGRVYGPPYVGERVPTLAEVIDLAKGRIRLQIELKYYVQDDALAAKVARLVEEKGFEDQCVIISLNYEGLKQVRRANPRLRTAAIVTVSVGDIDRLDVDALSVNSRHLSGSLIRAVKSRHKDLYAWTVDDPRRMLGLIERGVPNIVTNRPDLLIGIRDELAGMPDVERRLLAARHLLGLEPELAARAGEGPGEEEESP
ncbi:Glycerophosphoryl diester phosphodiesterase [Aquisphaera giovannonii]|uniref:Glycerophosphoryl diester phosphodiesterase n=1 Tax=Aquisphaera giovannonii TaxID=406548 RepID=A0A5B9W0P6_9BACT|nr:glycerophosphodiester phosphodiesterase family protein [Aquisphaera giovannonii]QEH34186.1 Glycerophosphoryl diester phosphodiesterase [Aquisphaera giovannonii]